MERIKEKTQIGEFNNAMIEIYDSTYRKMGSHSDQALDLADDSYIAIYSCYEDPATTNLRKLIVQQKGDDIDKQSKILSMHHDSVIFFSTSTNSQHLHKIVLDTEDSNRWLGITFRLSKTFIKWIDGVPTLTHSGIPLTLANKEESKRFYKFRSEENREVQFNYPELNYTVSPSDLLSV